MHPTASRLNDRTAELAADLLAAREQLAIAMARLNATSPGMSDVQFAHLIGIVTLTRAELADASRRIDAITAKLDRVGTDLATARGKAEGVLEIAQWGAKLFAVGCVLLFARVLWVSWEDGRTSSRLEQQQKTLDEIRSKLN